jgi:signal transduction histidine kinase
MKKDILVARNPECDGLRGGSRDSGLAGLAAAQVGHVGEASGPGAVEAGAVHDLNNLLTVVLGSLEQLRRQPLDGQGRTQLDRAQWGARQAGRLARQVLAAARGETDDGIVDLNDAVRTFDAMVGQVAGQGVSLVVKASPKALPARIDAGQLELALLNLVRNAADAMPGGGRIVVRTAGHRVDGLGGMPTVAVSVSDTGTGMSPEIVRRATDPFFTTKGGRGTSLGLWMVQRFAHEAGGKVEIETRPGRGTTVRVTLPRADQS